MLNPSHDHRLPVPIDDPRTRPFARRRFGSDIVRNGRRALMRAGDSATQPVMPVPRPRPADDDLVELMAQALVRAARFDALDLDDAMAVETGLIGLGFAPLDAGRADIVAPATARARARLRGGALLDHAGMGAAFGSLLLAATAASCLISSPAHAAAIGTLLTDERIARIVPFTPLAIAIALGLAFFWRERPAKAPEEPASEPRRPRFVHRSPATAPDLGDIEVRRAPDHG